MAKILVDQSIFLWLNYVLNVKDAVANNLNNHQKCWFEMQRETDEQQKRKITQMTQIIDGVLADIEL